jgi:oligoendopeptidase F
MTHLRNIFFDKDFTENGKYSGDLPEWDLTDLYKNVDCSEIDRDLNWLEKECKNFANEFEGKLAELNAIEFLACLRRSEKISNISGRLISYAGLRYYQATTDGERTKFLSDIQEKITIYTSSLIFFNLELNRLPNGHLDGLYSKN